MRSKDSIPITKILQYFTSSQRLAKYKDSNQLKNELQDLLKIIQFSQSQFPQKIKKLKKAIDDYTNQVQNNSITINDFVYNYIPTQLMKTANYELAYDIVAKSTNQRIQMHKNQQYNAQFQMKLKFLQSQGIKPELWASLYDKGDKNMKIKNLKYCINLCLYYENKIFKWRIRKVQEYGKVHHYLNHYYINILLPEFKQKIQDETKLLKYLMKSVHFCQCYDFQRRFQQFFYNRKVFKPLNKINVKVGDTYYQIIFPESQKSLKPIIKIRQLSQVQLKELLQKQKQNQIKQAKSLQQKQKQKSIQIQIKQVKQQIQLQKIKQQKNEQQYKNNQFLSFYISSQSTSCQLKLGQHILSCQFMNSFDVIEFWNLIQTIHIYRKRYIRLCKHLNIIETDSNHLFPLIRFNGQNIKDVNITSQPNQDIQREITKNGFYLLARTQDDKIYYSNQQQIQQSHLQVVQQTAINLQNITEKVQSSSVSLVSCSYIIMYINEKLQITIEGLQPGLINNLWPKYSLQQLMHHIDFRKRIAKLGLTINNSQNPHHEILFGIFSILIDKTQEKVLTQYQFRQFKFCFVENRSFAKRQNQSNDDFILSLIISDKFKDIKFKFFRYGKPYQFDYVQIYFNDKWKNYIETKKPEETLSICQLIQVLQYLLFHFITQRFFSKRVNDKDKDTLRLKFI